MDSIRANEKITRDNLAGVQLDTNFVVGQIDRDEPLSRVDLGLVPYLVVHVLDGLLPVHDDQRIAKHLLVEGGHVLAGRAGGAVGPPVAHALQRGRGGGELVVEAQLVQDAVRVGLKADAGADRGRNLLAALEQDVVDSEPLEHQRQG